MKPVIAYDQNVQAIYVRLSTMSYHHGRDLDEDRRIDYAEDDTPFGVELLGVDDGVCLDGLPSSAAIAAALKPYGIRILETGQTSTPAAAGPAGPGPR